MEDFSLKQCYDVDLTISRSQYGRSQYGRFSTSVWFDAQPMNMNNLIHQSHMFLEIKTF